jgi:heme/copper-type cytochrome/quinol oxidase subunit 1
MKRELIWGILFLVLSVLIVGQMTGFQFENIDIQLHDTYYVAPSIIVVLFILTIFGLLRGLVKLTDRLSDKTKSIAIVVTVINGLFWTDHDYPNLYEHNVLFAD